MCEREAGGPTNKVREQREEGKSGGGEGGGAKTDSREGRKAE